MKINCSLLQTIKRCFSQKTNRAVFDEYFRLRNQEALSSQRTAFFKANRLWQQGNDRLSTRLLFKDQFSADEMTKGEFLRSEAVLEPLKAFTRAEYAYFVHCIQAAVKKRLDIEIDPESQQRLKSIAGIVIRHIHATTGTGT